jgi:hypothetical protein
MLLPAAALAALLAWLIVGMAALSSGMEVIGEGPAAAEGGFNPRAAAAAERSGEFVLREAATEVDAVEPGALKCGCKLIFNPTHTQWRSQMLLFFGGEWQK